MSFSAAQCRAARALLHWSQRELADASKLATKTIADFERLARAPYERTLPDMQRALEAAGIEFINSGKPGVRINPIKAQIRDKHWRLNVGMRSSIEYRS
jgi:transcriptional regulator with XRE-family HTH domain